MFSPTSLSPKNRQTVDLQDSGSSYMHDEQEYSDAMSDGGTATMVTQKQLKINDISFISKSEYENLENCLICNISFEKFGGVSQHHCRACGASVCGPCSRRQINNNRVCDLCFLRCFLKKTEQRRRDQLETKKKTISTLKTSQESLKQEIKKVEKEITDIKENKYKELEQLKKTLQKKKDESYDIAKELTQHEQMLSAAEIQLQLEKQRQQDLEKQQISYESQLKGLQVDLEQKKKIIEQKQTQVKSLMDQKNKLTSTKSFLNYKNQKSETYNESDEEQENEEAVNDDQSVNYEKDIANTPGNHYSQSTVTKNQNQTKNYELNEKQNSNDKCYCKIF